MQGVSNGVGASDLHVEKVNSGRSAGRELAEGWLKQLRKQKVYRSDSVARLGDGGGWTGGIPERGDGIYYCLDVMVQVETNHRSLLRVGLEQWAEGTISCD